jgi:dolichol-phosphate mannosyltransferase
MISLAIVLPTLNEAENLVLLLPKVLEVARTIDADVRVCIVDGGSSDGTADVARRAGVEVIQQRGKGYGGAIKTAFDVIEADYILTMDADFSHNPSFINYMWADRENAEIIIASRYMPGGYGVMPMLRVVLSGALNWVFRHLLSVPVMDLSSGYRLYRRKAVAKLDLQYETYAVLQEILVKAYSQGYTVHEIPFHYLPRRHGQTHAKLAQFALVYMRALFALWRIRNSVDSADYDWRAFNSRLLPQRWWQRKRYHILLGLIGDKLRVLDTGCGSTQLLNGLPQIVGMDIKNSKLRFMRRPGRSLVNASTFDLPFADHSFEVLVSSQVIEHIAADEGIFEEFARILEPGGYLVVGTPDYGRWQWPLIERIYAFLHPGGYASEHITHYTEASLREILQRHGFEVVERRSILNAELVLKAQLRK